VLGAPACFVHSIPALALFGPGRVSEVVPGFDTVAAAAP
jgi:hypothetical protein